MWEVSIVDIVRLKSDKIEREGSNRSGKWMVKR